MATYSKLHLGPTFDPVKYNMLEEQLTVTPETEPQRVNESYQRRDHLSFGKIKNAVKRVVRKGKVAAINLTRRGERETTRGCGPKKQEFRQQVKAISSPGPSYAGEQGPVFLSPPNTSRDVNGDDSNASSKANCYEMSKRLYKCNLSSDTKISNVEQGHVQRLIRLWEENLNNSVNKHTPSTHLLEGRASKVTDTASQEDQTQENVSIEGSANKLLESPVAIVLQSDDAHPDSKLRSVRQVTNAIVSDACGEGQNENKLQETKVTTVQTEGAVNVHNITFPKEDNTLFPNNTGMTNEGVKSLREVLPRPCLLSILPDANINSTRDQANSTREEGSKAAKRFRTVTKFLRVGINEVLICGSLPRLFCLLSWAPVSL